MGKIIENPNESSKQNSSKLPQLVIQNLNLLQPHPYFESPLQPQKCLSPQKYLHGFPPKKKSKKNTTPNRTQQLNSSTPSLR